MASMKVFVSSTCRDFAPLRQQLRSLLVSMGHEPVMSDHAEVLYDHRQHTHTSCLREVANCDAVILLIGSRFGGATIPKALELIDFDELEKLGRGELAGDPLKLSVTQAEVLRAIQNGVPVFPFVEAGLMRDHLTYEKNKKKSIIGEIEFSSVDKKDTARYIFEFINFLRLRNENNSILEFARFEDIESQLKKQWSGLFQTLLHEQRTRGIESRRIDNLSSQIADLKAAVLGSISSGELKETAKGAIRFRHVVDSVYAMSTQVGVNSEELLRSDISWGEVLRRLGVEGVLQEQGRGTSGAGFYLKRMDGTWFRVRFSRRMFRRLSADWEEFRRIGANVRSAIINAVIDGMDAERGWPIQLLGVDDVELILHKNRSGELFFARDVETWPVGDLAKWGTGSASIEGNETEVDVDRGG